MIVPFSTVYSFTLLKSSSSVDSAEILIQSLMSFEKWRLSRNKYLVVGWTRDLWVGKKCDEFEEGRKRNRRLAEGISSR